MSQWEYRRINLAELPSRGGEMELLAAAGDDGWELVTIASNGLAYFKRLVEEAPPAPMAPMAPMAPTAPVKRRRVKEPAAKD